MSLLDIAHRWHPILLATLNIILSDWNNLNLIYLCVPYFHSIAVASRAVTRMSPVSLPILFYFRAGIVSFKCNSSAYLCAPSCDWSKHSLSFPSIRSKCHLQMLPLKPLTFYPNFHKSLPPNLIMEDMLDLPALLS